MSLGVISRKLVGVLSLSNSCSLIRRQTSTREGRFLKKIMQDTKKKKGWHDDDQNLQKYFTPQKAQNYRRIIVLNNLFMEHVSSLISTGEICDELSLPTFEITKVKMATDFKQLNVYWLPKMTDNDFEFEKSLNTLASRLRHELVQLHVAGNVPKIVFCKDKTFSNGKLVDKLLETADFGDSFVPQDNRNTLKDEFSDYVNTIHIDQNEECTENSAEGAEEQLPPMRMDVFGLDHYKILGKIKREMKKSKATHRYEDASRTETESDNLYCDYDNGTVNPRKERLELIHFLQQRRIMNQKLIQHRKRLEDKEQYYKTFECNKFYDDSAEEVEESDFFSEECVESGYEIHKNR